MKKYALKRILDTTGAIPDDVNIREAPRQPQLDEAAGEQLKLTIGPAFLVE
jgi:hypothetical protein